MFRRPYVPYITETTKNNHFMYARSNSYSQYVKHIIEGPTGLTMITFEDWLKLAVTEHNKTLDQRAHLYFRFAALNPVHWLYEELPIFKPDSSFFNMKGGSYEAPVSN